MFNWILFVIPKKLLSRTVGWAVHLPLPGPLRLWTMQWFAKRYRIDLAEAEFPIEQYASIGDLFTRKLKEGLRPLGVASLVHPADSRLTQAGDLKSGRLIQAKGLGYSLEAFLGPLHESVYSSGEFATYYLCPTDYHRVHSPVTGRIRKVAHFPGAFWPVNEWSTQHIRDLFVVNERVAVEIETEKGLVAVVFVAATNVGQVSLNFWPEFQSLAKKHKSVSVREFNIPLSIQKGDELGIFHMGSTVVLCLSPGAVPPDWDRLPVGHNVRMGRSFYEAFQ